MAGEDEPADKLSIGDLSRPDSRTMSPRTIKKIQRQEEEAYDRERRRYELGHLQEQLDNLKQDRKERKRYAVMIFALISCWLLALLAILLLHGFAFRAFQLSDPVLLALIGGTTANVLGLFIVVMNYLFPKRG